MHVICVEHPFICFSLKLGDKNLQLLKLQAFSEDHYLLRFSTTGQIEFYFIKIVIRFPKKDFKFKVCLAPSVWSRVYSGNSAQLVFRMHSFQSRRGLFFMLSLP